MSYIYIYISGMFRILITENNYWGYGIEYIIMNISTKIIAIPYMLIDVVL